MRLCQYCIVLFFIYTSDNVRPLTPEYSMITFQTDNLLNVFFYKSMVTKGYIYQIGSGVKTTNFRVISMNAV